MPTLEEYILDRAATDHALAVLTLIVLFCCILLIRVWRVGFVRRAADAISYTLIPTFFTLALGLKVASQFTQGAVLASSLAIGAAITTSLPLPRIRISTMLALPAILSIGLIVRLPLINESLWYDEAFTATVARLSFEQLPTAIAYDVHPPLYYLLEWLWIHATGLYDAPFMFMLYRLPSLLLGLLAIYLIHRLTLLVTFRNTAVARTAALLLALTPAAIYYSVEARSYALLIVLAFGALIALFEEHKLLFYLFIALLPMTHSLGWAYAGVLALLALYRWRWQAVLPLATAFTLASPSLLLALRQSGSMTDGYWLHFNFAQPLWTLIFNIQSLDQEFVVPLLLPYIAVTFLSFWVTRHLFRANPNTQAMGLFMAGVPAAVLVISILWQPSFLHRAFLPVTLLLLVPLAYALHSSSARYFRPIVACIVVISLSGFYSNSQSIRPDYRTMLNECGDARTVYATSLQSAFLARANSSRDVVIWYGAVDNGETLTADQMRYFGFATGEMPSMGCLLFEDSPRAADTERAYVNLLTAIGETHHALLIPHPLKHIHIYVVE